MVKGVTSGVKGQPLFVAPEHVVEVVQDGEGDDAQEHPLTGGEPPPKRGGWLADDRGPVHCRTSWNLVLVSVKIGDTGASCQ
jgi:hypothetical protein